MACVGLTAAGRWGGGDGYCARTVAGVGGAEVTSCPWQKPPRDREKYGISKKAQSTWL